MSNEGEDNESNNILYKTLPKNSILFQEDDNDNDSKEEIFNTKIFTNMVSEHKKILKEKSLRDPIRGKLRNLMICGSCKRNLKDLYYCPSCKGYFCRKCFNKNVKYLKKDKSPCPLCKNLISRANLKLATLLKAIAEVAEDEEDDTKLIKFNPIEIIPKCDKHNQNKIWVYCIDCNRKMCPVCYENEKDNHSNHRNVNYAKYLELNLFFGNSFKIIKNFVLNSENKLKELQKVYDELDDQKNSLLQFFLKAHDKTNEVFSEEQKKIAEMMFNLTKKISVLNNFRKNIKKYVTKLIPKGYSEFDNMEELKTLIKERVEKMNIELPKDYEMNIIEKDYYKKDAAILERIEQKIDINNQIISKGLNTNIKGDKNYIFNIELSGQDVHFYLNINKIINGKQNNNSYLIKMIITDEDKNKKILYLDFNKDNNNEDENYITYNNSIPRNEIGNINKKGEINIRIDYLKLILN